MSKKPKWEQFLVFVSKMIDILLGLLLLAIVWEVYSAIDVIIGGLTTTECPTITVASALW